MHTSKQKRSTNPRSVGKYLRDFITLRTGYARPFSPKQAKVFKTFLKRCEDAGANPYNVIDAAFFFWTADACLVKFKMLYPPINVLCGSNAIAHGFDYEGGRGLGQKVKDWPFITPDTFDKFMSSQHAVFHRNTKWSVEELINLGRLSFIFCRLRFIRVDKKKLTKETKARVRRQVKLMADRRFECRIAMARGLQ